MLIRRILTANALLNDIDIQFAEYICRKQGVDDSQLWLLTAMISFSANRGDSAFDPSSVSGKSLAELFNKAISTDSDAETDPESLSEDITFPEFDIQSLLTNSRVIGTSDKEVPIIFDSGLFFLNKFFNYEQAVIHFIKPRVGQPKKVKPSLKQKLNELFPENHVDGYVNWQKVAAILAICNDFLVISGGPGTGKTTTSGKILALLLEENPNLRIKMVAPTGKAADRLNESMGRFKASYASQLSPEIIAAIPEDAETIHRFTGIYMDTPKYNELSPAPVDLLLIDEASMVSLPLFAATFRSLKSDCKVILLGDKDQLMAVENGNVLNDITSIQKGNSFSANFAATVKEMTDSAISLEVASSENSHFADIAVQLEHSWRFDQHSGIGELSRVVNQATEQTDEEEIFSLFDKYTDIKFEDIQNISNVESYISDICSGQLQAYIDAVQSHDIDAVFEQLSKFRILCAVNNSPFGVNETNAAIERKLFPKTVSVFYHGKAIMITRNDHRLGLSNGDVGVILEEVPGKLKAYFPGTDGELRYFTPSSLDAYTTAFAISIHKSQGSEFDNIVIMLPNEESPLLRKELIYTAITRAKKSCTIVASRKMLHRAATSKMERQSGIRNKILQ